MEAENPAKFIQNHYKRNKGAGTQKAFSQRIEQFFKDKHPEWGIQKGKRLKSYGIKGESSRLLVDFDIKTNKKRWILKLRNVRSKDSLDKEKPITWDSRVKRPFRSNYEFSYRKDIPKEAVLERHIGPLEEKYLYDTYSNYSYRCSVGSLMESALLEAKTHYSHISTISDTEDWDFGAIISVGKEIVINDESFERWLKSQK